MEAKCINKTLGDFEALNHVEPDIEAGEFISCIGKS
jgi:ABC-type Fe3+/spermidine/putrescine transport system ATPase subunit